MLFAQKGSTLETNMCRSGGQRLSKVQCERLGKFRRTNLANVDPSVCQDGNNRSGGKAATDMGYLKGNSFLLYTYVVSFYVAPTQSFLTFSHEGTAADLFSKKEKVLKNPGSGKKKMSDESGSESQMCSRASLLVLCFLTRSTVKQKTTGGAVKERNATRHLRVSGCLSRISSASSESFIHLPTAAVVPTALYPQGQRSSGSSAVAT